MDQKEGLKKGSAPPMALSAANHLMRPRFGKPRIKAASKYTTAPDAPGTPRQTVAESAACRGRSRAAPVLAAASACGDDAT